MSSESNKVFLCFGGSSGMGEATVRRFSKSGARVVIADRDEAAANRIIADLTAQGSDVLFVRTDCTSETDICEAVDFTARHFGRIDASLYTPGCNASGNLEDLTLERWQQGIALNLTGVFLYMKYVIRQMKRNGGGAICTISSENSVAPCVGFGNYCATKAAVDMLTRVAAMEVGRSGIRVFSVNPGFVKTPLVAELTDIGPIAQQYRDHCALGRRAEPHEIASAVFALCSDDFSYFTGENLILDGGAQHYGYPDIRATLLEMKNKSAQ